MMRRLSTVGVLVGVLWLLGGHPGHAALLYDNGAPSQLSGNEMTQWIQAEDFTLSAAATITNVRFWDLEDLSAGPGYAGSITWAIYADAGGSPGALVAGGNTAGVTRVATGNVLLFGADEFQNDFSIGAVALGPGAYWLGLHNGTLGNDSSAEFYWEMTGDFDTLGNGHEDEAPFAGLWAPNGFEHAFQLFETQSVPGPGALALLGIGLAGLLVARRRRKK